MSMTGWEQLACSCSSDSFVATHRIIWREGHGTTNKQHGWRCTVCGDQVSTAKLIQVARARHNREKIKELEADSE